jgi:hypothetical protein
MYAARVDHIAPADGAGADIGDRDTLTVTVRGFTAVPALALVGQLLLALLVLAAGARLRGVPGHRSR